MLLVIIQDSCTKFGVRAIADNKNKKEIYHDLLYLSGMCGLELNGKEKRCLEKLGKITISIGRYPVSRNWVDHSLDKDRRVKYFSWGTEDEFIISNFILKINQIIKS